MFWKNGNKIIKKYIFLKRKRFGASLLGARNYCIRVSNWTLLNFLELIEIIFFGGVGGGGGKEAF